VPSEVLPNTGDKLRLACRVRLQLQMKAKNVGQGWDSWKPTRKLALMGDWGKKVNRQETKPCQQHGHRGAGDSFDPIHCRLLLAEMLQISGHMTDPIKGAMTEAIHQGIRVSWALRVGHLGSEMVQQFLRIGCREPIRW
jgi:hypothetical protein